jgi:hypothetical protein
MTIQHMRTKWSRGVIPNQVIGNIGLFYVCYKLSLFGWNVMPTARNSKGVDIIAYSQNGSRRILIQVKSLSRTNSVSLGKRLDNLLGDFVVIWIKNHPNEPICFVMQSQTVKKLAHRYGTKRKVSYWLRPSEYHTDEHLGKWLLIGHGVP